MKNILVILGVLAVVAVVGAAGYERFFKPNPPVIAGPASSAPAEPAAAPATPVADALQVRPGDLVIGEAAATVTIIEYASLTCPHCAAFHANTLPALKERYIDKGNVKLVFRDFPLDGLALRAAMLPHCAGPERYYGLLGTLFARQLQWATAKDPLNALSSISLQAGMNGEEFKACLANKAIEDQVLQSAMEASKGLGVNATPTLFINGLKYSGALTIEQIGAVVDPLVGAK